MVDTITPRKNNLGIIKAFDIIKDRTDCKSLFAGGFAWKSDEIHEYIRVNNLEKRVILPGYLKNEKLEQTDRLILTGYLLKDRFDRILKKACLFVNTSSFEGFGMSAVESMYAEVPCLLADNSAVREVTLGRCSYYSPADDEKKLAESLMNAMSLKRDSEYLRETSEIIEEKYDYKRITAQYLEFFNELCNKG